MIIIKCNHYINNSAANEYSRSFREMANNGVIVLPKDCEFVHIDPENVDHDIQVESPTVYYLCDERACKECTDACTHTHDINHAKNFRRMENGDMWEYQRSKEPC